MDAVVRGTEDYEVRLEPGIDVVRGSCTCPYFFDRLEACKHLWAVVLACDARGISVLPPDAQRDEAGFEPIDPDEDEDDDEFAPPVQTRGGAPGWSRPSAPRPRAATVPAWRQMLEAIGQAARTPDVRVQPIASQLLYVVDLSASQQARTLVVHLMSQEQKKNGDWGVPRAAQVVVHSLGALADSGRATGLRMGVGRIDVRIPLAVSSAWAPRRGTLPAHLRHRPLPPRADPDRRHATAGRGHDTARMG